MQSTAQLNEAFSEPGASAPSCADVEDVLSQSEMFWISTVRRNSTPHVTPLPAIWLDGTLHFCVGARDQKAKNIQTNPHCVLTTGTNRMRSGLDVIVEGTAAQVTDEGRLRQFAGLWKSKLDWNFDVHDGAFRDDAGRIGLVFGVKPTKVLAFGKAPFTQTRFRATGHASS